MLEAGSTRQLLWLQHNGVPAHFSLIVHGILNKPYLGCWIVDHGLPASPVPLSWPPCSPYLTTLDNSLRGFIEGQVCCTLPSQWWWVVGQALANIMPQMLWCMSHRTWCIWVCVLNMMVHVWIHLMWHDSPHGTLSKAMMTSWSPVQHSPELAAAF
jgi:hypothetical protein